ncbi:amidohydrolase family protein [Candidatus Nitrosacidococcus sp. I8]|uniref:amidohydrolase family protein n=1 Tax=Candidatus Nitrosacidococcus sp. I8 TaxID=2942908 RepID=UPI002226F124|nr:amidohydrolase family protein [Candidatus Nitrosacidococcus sp. I8]CAH9016866.1 Dihydroorotase-like protein [Candidatus Nitrosacidococcus sp. I8]
MGIAIIGGRLIDPLNQIDALQDVYITNGKIAAIGAAPEYFPIEQTINAEDKVVCPSFVDLRAKLWGTYPIQAIQTEILAAAKGGVTTVCGIPDIKQGNTLFSQILQEFSPIQIVPLGILTQDFKGLQLTEMAGLSKLGYGGVTNGLVPIENTQLLNNALSYAATLGLKVFLYPRDAWLGIDGYCHEGVISARLGLKGIPETAETIALARDLQLVEQTGVQAHFCNLSTKKSVQMIKAAQIKGLPVTADVTAYHLHLTEHDIGEFDSQCHTIPPLRSPLDRDGLQQGLQEGILSGICSDHQPCSIDAKLGPFARTKPGISGLETLLPLCLRLVQEDILTLNEVIAYLTYRPAQILGIDTGHLACGQLANVCIFDPDYQWVLNPAEMVSYGKNTPFGGWKFQGIVTHTLVAGEVIYKATLS